MKMIVVILLLLCLLVLCSSYVIAQEADTVFLHDGSLDNLGDTYIWNNEENNHGTEQELKVDGSTLYSTFIKFNIANLSKEIGGYEVTNATLGLYVKGGSSVSAADTYLFHVYNHTWNETNITWSASPNPCKLTAIHPINADICNITATDTHDSPYNPTTNTFEKYDATVILKRELNEGFNNASFLITRVTSDNARLDFHSREYTGDITLRPFLNVTYIKSNLNASNVSITPSPANIGSELKGHGRFNFTKYNVTGNLTRWYINKTLVEEANNNFVLNSPNASQDANITFSIKYDYSNYSGNWINSSTITIGDLSNPNIFDNQTSSPTVTINSEVTIFANVTENSGNLEYVRVEVEDPNQQKDNLTMTLNQGTQISGKWSISYTASVVGTHSLVFYAKDGSNNEFVTGNELIFSAVEPEQEEGSGGGGGSAITNQGLCSLELFRPFEGRTISMTAEPNELTVPAPFVIKNAGNASGSYKFEVAGNEFLESVCVFEFDKTNIDPGLSFQNTIQCTSNDQVETGSIKITACGLEKNYNLVVSSSEALACFNDIISGGEINCFGFQFSQARFWGSLFLTIILGILSVFIISTITAWGVKKWNTN